MGGAGYHGFSNGIAVGYCAGASVSLAGASVKIKTRKEQKIEDDTSILPLIAGPAIIYMAGDDSSNSIYDSHGCDSDCGSSSDGGCCGGD